MLVRKIRSLYLIMACLVLFLSPQVTHADSSISFQWYVSNTIGYPKGLASPLEIIDNASVTFFIDSSNPIEKVTAQFENSIVDLGYGGIFCFSRFDCRAGWSAIFLAQDFVTNGDHLVTLTATDVNGNVGIATMHVIIESIPQDTTPPIWQVDRSLFASDITETSVHFNWTPILDNAPISQYRLYKNTNVIDTLPATIDSYNVTGLTAGQTYHFHVEAADLFENWSDNGPSLNVTTSVYYPVQAVLSGQSPVTVGQSVYVDYGLTHVTGSVYSQQLKFSYDPTKLTFDSAQSLKTGVFIVGQKADHPGNVFLILASTGAELRIHEDGTILRLHFLTVPSISQSKATKIVLSKGILANDKGDKTILPLASFIIQLKIVDRSALLNTIVTAQNLYDYTVEGNKIGQVSSGDKAALQHAIDQAKTIAANPSATQVNQASNRLLAAIQTFQASIIQQVDGDVNSDGQITIGDLGIAATSFGLNSSSPNWSQVKFADMNHDSEIDIVDINGIAAKI